MHNTPVTEDDLDFIDATLEKYGGDESIFSVSELDGFLTAIVSGPDMVLPSEWIPAIWGGNDEMPEWESEQELSRFIGIVMAIMNQNARLLMEQPEAFEAMFLIDIEDGEPVEIVSLWCYGYMRAVALRRARWMELPADVRKHMGNIILFGSEEGEESLDQLSDADIANLQKKIDPAARAIHAYWLAQRSHLGSSSSAKILPFIRQQPKVGPNEPCPCGSGKKYKKCCGLH